MTTLKNILFRNWFGLAIAIIILFFLVKSCNEISRLQRNYKAVTTKNTTYKNHLGTLTTKIATQELTEKELRQQISDTVAKLAKPFHKVNTVIVTNTVTKIDTIKITFKEPIPCDFVRQDTERKEWYSFNYKIDNKGFVLSNFDIPNQQTVISGLQRKWFLGKSTIVTEVTNTNPFVCVINATSYKTEVKPNWLEKTAYFIAGALVFKGTQELTK